MRLVTTFQEEEVARRYYSHLSSEGVKALFEVDKEKYQIWIYDEELIEKAEAILKEFEKNPHDSKFDVTDDVQIEAPKAPGEISEDPVFIARMQEMKKKLTARPLYAHIRASLTKLTISLCVILFLLNTYQGYGILKERGNDKSRPIVTPIDKELFFEVPYRSDKLAEKRGEWIGLYYIAIGWPATKGNLDAPKFTDIREGQVWRLITPVLLHGGILHLLFNMMWLWLLGKQIEERLGKGRYFLMMLLIGVISNIGQYMMSGPAFLGFSGVVCGLAGFIWMRQKLAPWEGYPLQKSAAIFLAIFVLGIAFIQVVSFALKIMGLASLPIQVANTAHIMGALVGIVLARVSLFSRIKHER